MKAAKGDSGRILEEVVGVTGWSRYNARRRLAVAAGVGSAGSTSQDLTEAEPRTGH